MPEKGRQARHHEPKDRRTFGIKLASNVPGVKRLTLTIYEARTRHLARPYVHSLVFQPPQVTTVGFAAWACIVEGI
jgi:hypothetical protein